MAEQQNELILWVLGGYGFILGYIALAQIKSDKNVAVLQKSVDDLASDVRTFIGSEIETLKDLINRIHGG